MADDADRAQKEIDRLQEDALARLRVRAIEGERAAALLRGVPSHCVDCGDEIDPARREAMPSAVRCLPCQSDAERMWL